jgi:hypothetical protein
MLGAISNAKKIMPPMLPQLVLLRTKIDPMQIDEIIFKPLTEQKKRRRYTHNLCLYYVKPNHVARECPKKCPHIAHATSFIHSKFRKLKNRDV